MRDALIVLTFGAVSVPAMVCWARRYDDAVLRGLRSRVGGSVSWADRDAA